jgi:hypothetical protein
MKQPAMSGTRNDPSSSIVAAIRRRISVSNSGSSRIVRQYLIAGPGSGNTKALRKISIRAPGNTSRTRSTSSSLNGEVRSNVSARPRSEAASLATSYIRSLFSAPFVAITTRPPGRVNTAKLKECALLIRHVRSQASRHPACRAFRWFPQADLTAPRARVPVPLIKCS